MYYRYIFKKTFFTWLCFLFLSIAIFFFIDLAIHLKELSSEGLLTYYLGQISQNFTFLVSLSFLLAQLKTLYELSSNQEILALQTAGIGYIKIISPLCAVCAIATSMAAANLEWGYPNLYKTKSLYFQEKELKTVYLEDGSKLLYLLGEDPFLLEDFYWINRSTITHAATVLVESRPYIAKELLVFSLDPSPSIQSHQKEGYIEINVEKQILQPGLLLKSSLSSQFLHRSIPKVAAHFYFELLFLLCPLLLFCTLSPYFRKRQRQSKIAGFSILSIVFFVSVWTLLFACKIAAESGLFFA